MARVATFLAMWVGTFILWQSIDYLHVWIALRQDEKREREEKEREIRRLQEELIQQAQKYGGPIQD